MIENHYSATLSELDVAMIKNVPPGGNWKNIPKNIPSQRLEQIRESFAKGEGSRSTYYGRLKPEDPAFTITTYFNRPGNGCFAHYDFEGQQHRLISQREAARLQSFPDSFVFRASKGSIYKQIGNAVPPLLAYQIASMFSFTGQFVDLFSGAGGLALGFQWAGWQSLVANDVEKSFLDTHSTNIDGPVIHGDITNPAVFSELIDVTRAAHDRSQPLIVLGGPPCQGFSTAGKARSMNDVRNHLFKSYAKVLDALAPSHFIFENVPGILNMESGTVLAAIKSTLAASGYNIQVWKLTAEEYGVPQRRQRVFLVGNKDGEQEINVPLPITSFKRRSDLFTELNVVCGVFDALGDLPRLMAGEDGSQKSYLQEASTNFQRFVRGAITPAEYIESLRKEKSDDSSK